MWHQHGRDHADEPTRGADLDPQHGEATRPTADGPEAPLEADAAETGQKRSGQGEGGAASGGGDT